jgi:hypothetical protein
LYSFVGAGYSNQVDNYYGGIVSGYDNAIAGWYGFIGSGYRNNIASTCSMGVIGGGYNNEIACHYAFIGSGYNNQIVQDSGAGYYSCLVGGFRNEIDAGYWCFVGAGYQNLVTLARYSSIVGGDSNDINGAWYAFIGGGDSNAVTGVAGVIGGGLNNDVTGQYGTISGGRDNDAGGYATSVPGGEDNTAKADYSSASGLKAEAMLYGEQAQASGTFSGNKGESQTSVLVVRGQTSDATPTPLYLDGGSVPQRMVMEPDTCWTIVATVNAFAANGTKCGGWLLGSTFRRDGTTAPVEGGGTTTKVSLREDDPTWDVIFQVNAAKNAIELMVQGAAGIRVRWTARVEIVQTRAWALTPAEIEPLPIS